MKSDLIEKMHCPACRAGFTLAWGEEAGDRVQWGLLRCDCFEYPIVDGILLLSLAKGYGGPEESYQPYQALLAAGITYLRRRDRDGLLAWIARHIPLLHQLIAGRAPETYFEFIRRHQKLFDLAFARVLQSDTAFDILGWREERRRRGGRFSRPMMHLLSSRAGVELLGGLHPLLRKPRHYWYFQRWLDGRLAASRTALSCWPLKGPILSLACGHGVAEALFQHLTGEEEIVSVDGQMINLWVTRTYVAPRGVFILHDLSSPLPFADGQFGTSFCSTSFQEIPGHYVFAREKIRVTEAAGLAFFDHAWWPEERVSPLRAYRYCQNMIETPEAAARILRAAAGERSVYCAEVPADPVAEALWRPAWHGPGEGAAGAGVSFAVATIPPRTPSPPANRTNLYERPSFAGPPPPARPARDVELALQRKEAFILPAAFAAGLRPY